MINSSLALHIMRNDEEPFHSRKRRAHIVNVLCRCIPSCYRSRTGGGSMGFKRKSSRVEVGRPGRLHRGSFSAPCQVMNVSETGVRIQTRLFVKNGDVLHLSIELDGGRQLGCEIQAINVGSRQFGAKILSISPEDRERLAHILRRAEQTPTKLFPLAIALPPPKRLECHGCRCPKQESRTKHS